MTRLRAGVSIGILATLLLASSSSGQGVIGVGPYEGSMEFAVSADSAASVSDGVTSDKIDHRRTEERIGLRGDMFLFARNFAALFYGVNLGFLQDRFKTTGQRLPAKARLADYDLSANFLSTRKYGLTLFANRAESVNSREFVGTSETKVRNEGITLHLRSFIVPGTVNYRRELFEEAARLSGSSSNSNYETRRFSYDGQNTFGSHEVSAHYEAGDLHDRFRPDFSYGNRTATVRDRYTSSGDLPDTLTSSVHYFRRDGRMRLTSLFLDEDYRVTHTGSLSSRYSYVLSRFVTDNLPSTTSHTGSASVQHRLYESLASGAGLFGSLIRVPDGLSRLWAVRANTNYRKRLPRQAQLLANLSGLFQVNDNRVRGRALNIFQERQVARLGIPFRLDQPRPLVSTVIVTSEAGALFQEGTDYVVRLVGEFAEIQIVPSGRIRDGDALLIEYRVNVSPTATLSTRAFSARVEPDFGWVSPYYSYERTAQHLVSGTADSPLEGLTGRTAGVRFRWNTSRLSAMLLNEYHTQESRLIPYDALQFSQFFNYIIRQQFSVSVTFNEALHRYRRPQRETSSGTGRITAGWMPTPTVSIDAFASARLWSDTFAADEMYRDAGVRAQWSTPTFTVVSSFNSDVRRRNGSAAEQSRFTAAVTRRF